MPERRGRFDPNSKGMFANEQASQTSDCRGHRPFFQATARADKKPEAPKPTAHADAMSKAGMCALMIGCFMRRMKNWENGR